jgi:hypothetical protein
VRSIASTKFALGLSGGATPLRKNRAGIALVLQYPDIPPCMRGGVADQRVEAYMLALRQDHLVAAIQSHGGAEFLPGVSGRKDQLACRCPPQPRLDFEAIFLQQLRQLMDQQHTFDVAQFRSWQRARGCGGVDDGMTKHHVPVLIQMVADDGFVLSRGDIRYFVILRKQRPNAERRQMHFQPPLVLELPCDVQQQNLRAVGVGVVSHQQNAAGKIR